MCFAYNTVPNCGTQTMIKRSNKTIFFSLLNESLYSITKTPLKLKIKMYILVQFHKIRITFMLLFI